MPQRLKEKVRSLKAEIYCLYFAARHPRTPWYAKILVSFVAAYALSPIDLIPDFVPVLGYLDDLVLIPLGIVLTIRLIPPQVLEVCKTVRIILLFARFCFYHYPITIITSLVAT